MCYLPETAQHNTKGINFTMIELLVVISIIAILASILLPALRKAKQRAETIQCASQLDNIGNAVMFYTSDYDNYVPPFYDTDKYHTWHVLLLPYLGVADGEYYPALYECPADRLVWLPETIPGKKNILDPSYGGNIHILANNPYTKMTRITNPSQKVLSGDSTHMDEGNTRHSYELSNSSAARSFFRRHSLSANILWWDGHIKNHKNLFDIRGNSSKYWLP